MIKIFGFYILGLLLFALSAGLSKNFLLFGAAPNVLLLISIYLDLEEPGEVYLFFSFFAGLMLDFSTGAYLGSFSLSFLILSITLRFVSREIVALEKNWKYLPAVLLVFQSLLLFWLFFFNMAASKLVSAPQVFSFFETFKKLFWQYFYNLACLYPIWKLSKIPSLLEDKISPKTK